MVLPYAIGAAGGAAAGAVGGLASAVRDIERLNTDVRRDTDALQTSGVLPDAQPSFSLTPHKPHGMFSRFLLGILPSGFAVWLVTLLVMLPVLSSRFADNYPMAQNVMTVFFAAATAGFIGFVVPGLPLGGLLWLSESRARVRETTAAHYRDYWAHRQHVGQALATGQETPQDAAAALWLHHVDLTPPQAEADPSGMSTSAPLAAVPVTGSWHGVVGEPLSIAAEVESVNEAWGEGYSLNKYTQHYLRTGDGDLLSWMATHDRGLRAGDLVTLQGTVKSHTNVGGEATTELWYVQVVGDIIRKPREG